jgi:methionyl-tRNA formyltransferase
MKNELRIIFMGTPDFAVATLDALITHNYNVVGIITAPDKPAGRGRKLRQSAVKEYALKKGLNVLQPTNLKNEDFIEDLKALNANLQVVVAFRMLPKVVWDMPKYGTFNLHASLLPQYRGAAPIHWAIINGETETGVTTFFIDEKIDTGAIITSKSMAIETTETVGSLHDKLMHLGSELVVETVKRIEAGDVKTTIQPKINDLKTAYKLNKDNCKIDWNDTLDHIYNKIRGLNPFPAAWCTLINEDEASAIKIYGITKENAIHSHTPGKIVIEDKTLKVAANGGYIIVEELQLPGKRKMDIKALLNGYKFSDNAKLV